MLICASCETSNPEGSRFCNRCGSPLAEAASGLTVEERKVVTVLFCDLVGFTAASDAADPEDVRAMIHPYHQLLKTQIEIYGGTVEKFIGDAVMAVFGAPVAHEDDPERAVHAGLRILEAIEDANAVDTSLALRVRIGINTGEAVVDLGARPDRGEGIVTGDVVNTASRLQGVAPVDGIAVGEETHRATASVFSYEEMAPVELKGKAQPVRIWRATSAKARFGTELTRRHTTPLIGRELERDLLTATFERTVRDRSVHLVTVVGEPGIGKSRLVAELFSFIDGRDELVAWRQGRCLPYGEGVTFWALGEIVKAAAGILETDPPAVAAEKIDAVVPADHPDAAWLRMRLRPLVGLEAPAAERAENFTAWRRFLEMLAEAGPLVAVIEDLHWADEALLAFLEHVVEFASEVPMVVLVTARPQLFERAPGFAQSARNSNRVNLAPLSEAETARLTAALLDSTVLPAEVSALIVERAGGNPLYAEEFVRLLRDTELLRRSGASWSVAPAVVDLPLPSGVQGLIAARLDALEPDRKRLLQDASIIGKVFWTGALAEMGEREASDVEAILHELGRQELVRRHPASAMEGELEFAFWHGLVRDVCYGQIPRAQRVDRHVAAARWIEANAGERLEDHAEILAGHYATALELAAATGLADQHAALGPSARRYLMLAGERAMGLDVVGAEANVRRALDLAPTDDPERPEILLQMAMILTQLSRYAEAIELFDEAHEAFLAAGNVPRAAVTLAHSSIPLGRLGDPRAGEITTRALELLEPLPPSPELVVVLAEEAGSMFVSGRRSQRSRRPIGRWPSRPSSACRPPLARWGSEAPREPRRTRRGSRTCRRHSRSPTSRDSDAREPSSATTSPIRPSRSRGLRARLRGGKRRSSSPGGAGSTSSRPPDRVGAVEALTALGRWDEVLDRAPSVRALAEADGDVLSQLTLSYCTVFIATARGETGDLALTIPWIISASRETGEAPYVWMSFPPVAWATLELGGAEGRKAAIELLAEMDEATTARLDSNYAVMHSTAVRTAVAAGDIALAERLRVGFEPVLPLYEHMLVTSSAVIAEAKGELDPAAAGYADAAGRWEAFETPWERAQALLGLGRCLIALGRADEAGSPLTAAREVFVTLRARPSIAEVDGLIDAELAESG